MNINYILLLTLFLFTCNAEVELGHADKDHYKVFIKTFFSKFINFFFLLNFYYFFKKFFI